MPRITSISHAIRTTMHTLSTLTDLSRFHQEIKKSRFLALAMHVGTSEQALNFVHEMSDSAATHNCWAYGIGQSYRFNDDGEPGGTAGRPILQAIESQGLDRIAVVVTRWYGGIKLGAGGLARAYGGTAAECLRIADQAPIMLMARLAMHCGFAELPLLKARLRDLSADIESESFDAEGAILILQLPQDRADEASALISNISCGRSDIRQLD